MVSGLQFNTSAEKKKKEKKKQGSGIIEGLLFQLS